MSILVAHVGRALYYRTWFMLITAVVAGTLEIMGWSGRLWSSYNVLLEDPFLMQYVLVSSWVLPPTRLAEL